MVVEIMVAVVVEIGIAMSIVNEEEALMIMERRSVLAVSMKVVDEVVLSQVTA